MMNPIVVHLASGQSFFSGLILLIFAIVLAHSGKQRLSRLAVVPAVVGVLGIVLSSTAIPYVAYGLLGTALLGWISACWIDRRRKATSLLLATACLLCAGFEIPYHIRPRLNPVDRRSITIIGDSVTAGLGDDPHEQTWPVVLSRRRQLEIQDLSHVGETAASALRRARSHLIDSPVVFIEIGGNDILGSTSSAKFEQDLAALLAHVSTPGRQVVMLELPLPPFFHEYGRAQRAAARRHHIALVPKRVFMGLLAGSASTLDSIHLSQRGHNAMADIVWELVGPAYATAPDRREPAP